MWIKKSLAKLPRFRGFSLGARYPLRGAVFLWHRKSLWGYVLFPLVLNMLLFVGIAWLGFFALRKLVFTGLPPEWWAIIVKVFLAGAAGAAIILCSVFCFAFVGSVLAAPFYDALADRVARWLGAPGVIRGFWKQITDAVRTSILKLGLFLLLQLGLLILYIIPFFVGFFTYTTVGFLITAFFLAFEFLDVSFHREGWTFKERLVWCRARLGTVLGFGSSVALLLFVPVVNIFVPPIALIGSILLFSEEQFVTLPSRSPKRSL